MHRLAGFWRFAGRRPKMSEDVPKTSLKMSQDVLETFRQIDHRGGMATLASTDQPEARLGLTSADVVTASDVAEFLHPGFHGV